MPPRMPQDRSVDVSPFSILPTFYRGVCGCIGARVTYAQAEGPGYNDISRKLRDACYFTLRRIAFSLTEKVMMVSHITTVYCRCHPTAEDWGLCQDSECGPWISWKPQGTFAHEFLVWRPATLRPQVVFMMTHPSRPPLVLSEHKPWNDKMSIVCRPMSHESKGDQVLKSVGNESSRWKLACDP